MENPTQYLDAQIAQLHANGRLRVWSLIITFFGDAVALRGGRVGLSVLQDAMDLLKIEPGAVRTAMSRLTKDSWVVREREGRLSFYKLTPQGRYAFDEATRRIYSPGPPDWTGDWTIAITHGDHAGNLAAKGFMPLGGPAWIKPGSETGDPPSDVLVIRGQGTPFPPQLSSIWNLEGLEAHYSQFIANWQGFKTHGLTAAQAMAARTLLMHDWRRIVLRDPDLPATLLPANWPGTKALDLVRRIYAELAHQSEAWLDGTSLPPATDKGKLLSRFIVLRNIAN